MSFCSLCCVKLDLALVHAAGKEQFDGGAAVGVIPGLHPAAVIDGDLLHDRKSQATAAPVGSGAGWIATVEALKHVVQVTLA